MFRAHSPSQATLSLALSFIYVHIWCHDVQHIRIHSHMHTHTHVCFSIFSSQILRVKFQLGTTAHWSPVRSDLFCFVRRLTYVPSFSSALSDFTEPLLYIHTHTHTHYVGTPKRSQLIGARWWSLCMQQLKEDFWPTSLPIFSLVLLHESLWCTLCQAVNFHACLLLLICIPKQLLEVYFHVYPCFCLGFCVCLG